ncbi:S8 family peptidase [Halomarina halobia]|uniref:S8 family peptidase n=2 Tax=Halomarina halobia TaxID=3033386 RepID=A0ABD6A7A4_9EURY
MIVGTQSWSAVERSKAQADVVIDTHDFGEGGQAVVGEFSDSALAALSQRDDIRYIEPNGLVRAIDHGTRGTQTIPWGVDRIDADEVQHDGFTGRGADVGIIDTGIDSDHPDLQANLGTGQAYVRCGVQYDGTPCASTNGNACLEPWDDDDDHGTHVAGTVAAVNNTEGVVGVATSATLHAVKALDCNGVGTFSDIASAVVYVADQGWEVANMSLGTTFASQAVHDACKYAYRRNVVLVAAAGNDGPCTNCVNYPAAYDEVIAVSATTRNDTLADFSSTGPEIELAAPGSDVRSTIPGGYASFSGTSMASPHVGGAAAHLMAVGFNNANNITYDSNDTLTPSSYENPGGARGQLRDTAENIGLSEAEGGYGLVDVEAALAIGESGTVSVSQPNRTTWFTVNLERSYDNPIVIMNPVSRNGGHPCHVRLRNVASQSFQFQIEEWAYLDGAHLEETVHYVVFEAGAYTSSAGNRLEVDTMATDHQFTRTSFFQNFTDTPVVLSQPQTYRGQDPIVTRQRDASSNGVDIRLQEEEARGGHLSETVGYAAIEPGVFTINGVQFEVGRTPDVVPDRWYRIDFQQTYNSPLFVAAIQTFDESDTAGLRYRELTGSSVRVLVEEEQSRDSETTHATEVVGYAVIETSGLI